MSLAEGQHVRDPSTQLSLTPSMPEVSSAVALDSAVESVDMEPFDSFSDKSLAKLKDDELVLQMALDLRGPDELGLAEWLRLQPWHSKAHALGGEAYLKPRVAAMYAAQATEREAYIARIDVKNKAHEESVLYREKSRRGPLGRVVFAVLGI